MAERIKIGLVGCGGMSGAYMGGYRQLWSKGLRDFEIVAAGDIVEERAAERDTLAVPALDAGKHVIIERVFIFRFYYSRLVVQIRVILTIGRFGEVRNVPVGFWKIVPTE